MHETYFCFIQCLKMALNSEKSVSALEKKGKNLQNT